MSKKIAECKYSLPIHIQKSMWFIFSIRSDEIRAGLSDAENTDTPLTRGCNTLQLRSARARGIIDLFESTLFYHRFAMGTTKNSNRRARWWAKIGDPLYRLFDRTRRATSRYRRISPDFSPESAIVNRVRRDSRAFPCNPVTHYVNSSSFRFFSPFFPPQRCSCYARFACVRHLSAWKIFACKVMERNRH